MEPEFIEGYFDSIESTMDFSSPVDSSLLNADNNSNSEQQNKDPSASVQIPASNCGPEKFFQFLMAALQLLVLNYPEIVKNIDLALLEGKIEDIYNQIWHLSGSKGCPKYMKEESGRLMRLCQLLFPGNIKKRVINLDAKKRTTLFFVMACMRIQSFKGRRVRDPSISVEAFKEMLLRKMQELTAEDIEERMMKLIPFNIRKYYSLDIDKETGCATIGPKHDYQCFDNLDREEDFANFMEQNKNKTSDSKKRKREPNPNTTGKSNSRKSRRTTVNTTPRKGQDYVPIMCPATPPACPPRQVDCEDSFELTLMASLHRLKATNAEQYLNTVARLTSIAQSGLQQNGMGDASLLLFAEDPFNSMPDHQLLSMQQQQGHYQDQPQLEVVQQIQPDCVTNVTYTGLDHSVSYMLPQAPLALHDTYDAPLSPLVSRMLLGELNNVTNEIGIGESSGCHSPEKGPDVQSSSFELEVDEMGAMDFYPFVSGEEVHRTLTCDDPSLNPVPYSQYQAVNIYLKV